MSTIEQDYNRAFQAWTERDLWWARELVADVCGERELTPELEADAREVLDQLYERLQTLAPLYQAELESEALAHRARARAAAWYAIPAWRRLISVLACWAVCRLTRWIIVPLLFCLPAFAQFPTVTRITPGDVTNPALYQTIESHRQDPTLGENQRRVTIHSRPVFYPDKDGLLQPINTALAETVDLEHHIVAVGNETNLVKFIANADGETLFSCNGHRLRMRLSEVCSESTSKELPPVREMARCPTGIVTAGSQVALAGMLPGTTIEHRVQAGQIKELVCVDTPPDTAGMATVRYSWIWESDLQPILMDNEILWQTANGGTTFRILAPLAWDSKGSDLPCTYKIEPGMISVVFDAADMAKAAYPVVIDPTVTTDQTDAVANRSYADANEANGDDEWQAAYMRVTVPDLTGAYSSIDSASWFGRVQIDVGLASGIDEIYCDRTSDWDDTASASTLYGLSFNAATDTGLSADIASGDWAEFDILGTTATNGIIKIYEDDDTGGEISIKLLSTYGDTTRDTIATAVRCGYVDVGFGVSGTQFYSRADATSYWRVEIVYTATGGSTSHVGSGSVGVMISRGETRHGRIKSREVSTAGGWGSKYRLSRRSVVECLRGGGCPVLTPSVEQTVFGIRPAMPAAWVCLAAVTW